MVTIYDVARRAKVSAASVSLVVNDPQTNRVSAATKKLIQETVRSSGYRPSGIAKALSKGQSRILGLVVPMRDPIFFNHYIVEVLAGIQACLMECHYHLMIYSHGASTGGITKGEMLQSRYADGVIVLNTRMCSEQDMLDTTENLRNANIPFVMVNGHPESEAINYVGVDECEVGHTAAEYLIAKGHKRIGVLGGAQRSPGAVALWDGFKKTSRKHTLPAKYPLHVYTEYDRQKIAQTVETWVHTKYPVTAIFCDDQMAGDVYEALRLEGLSIPKDVAVLGRGDLALSTTLTPKLTTIRIPAVDIGRRAAELLIETVQKTAKNSRKVILPLSISLRESV